MQFDSSSTPKLWFKRIVLFKALNPIEVIREIGLHRGLNIIVGKASCDPALGNNPMAMAGHSVGKTTFCRLLRYCLGEQHFSTVSGEQHLRESLPHSWIGAELEVMGTPWAVLRPLGAQKIPSVAGKNASIEELVTVKENDFSYFEFRQGLDKLLPPDIHHPEFTYKWEHLLSWMTRDQECRLRKFEVWRDSDSCSAVPVFRKPKEYPVYLVRGMLDLLVPEESVWSHTLSDLVKEQSRLKEEQQRALLDADYFYRDASKRLAEFIGKFPDTRSDSVVRLDGPVMQAENYKYKLNEEYKNLEKRFEEEDYNFRYWKRYVDNAIESKKQIEALMMATPHMPVAPSLNTKIPTEYEQKQRELASITHEIKNGTECLFVNQMLLAQCSYVMEYIENLKKFKPVLCLSKERQKLAIADMEPDQSEKIRAIIKQQERIQAALDEAERQAKVYDSERKKILKELSSLEKEMELLDRAIQAFQRAESLCSGRVQDTEIQQFKERLEKIDSDIYHAKNQLDFFRGQSAKRDQGLQKLFDGLVRRILKADYSGSIVTSAENFTPQIRQGSAIAGAAVESLSFVLMDIAAMLAASKGIGHHPGFLVHDSPREADLDIDPYHSLFIELAALTEENGGKDGAPFQYIITTTTEPPVKLKDLIRLSLAAHPEEMMLFRKQLKNKGPLMSEAE